MKNRTETKPVKGGWMKRDAASGRLIEVVTPKGVRLAERDGADFLLRSGLVEVTEKKPSLIDDEIPF